MFSHLDMSLNHKIDKCTLIIEGKVFKMAADFYQFFLIWLELKIGTSHKIKGNQYYFALGI